MNLRSALMSLRSAPMSALMSFRSALMSLISAGKNGENVFISAKSSVVSKRAYESHKRAYEPQKRAYESQKRREKREKRVHKRNWNLGEVRNNRQPHVTYLFSHPVNQATGLQARQGDAVLEREKESSESLLIQHFAFLNTTVIAHRDTENYELL